MEAGEARGCSCKLSVPSVLLLNVCSLDAKMDHISLWRTLQRELRDCCVFVFMKTWLTGKIPDSGIDLAGPKLHRTDRVVSTSSKLHGRGLTIYINNSWCWDAKTIFKFCSKDVEFLTVKCRPFYLPCELTTVFITAVYVPRSASFPSAC